MAKLKRVSTIISSFVFIIFTGFPVCTPVALAEAGGTFTDNGIHYTVLTETGTTNTVEVAEADYSGNIIIPGTVDNGGITYTVTSIGYNAFFNCSGLESVSMPDSIASIGAYAFAYCSGLTSISLPAGVTSIGDYAFGNCTSLASISIPAGVSSIGEGLFFNCTSLKSIAFLSSTPPSFSINAFLIAPAGLQIIVPHGAVSAYADALSGKLPAGAQIIEAAEVVHAFTADGIQYTVLTQSGTTGTVEVAEADYSGNIIIPGTVDNGGITYTVTNIGYNAFSTCSGLTSISMPDSIASIGAYAFAYCSGLTSISIPADVTSIGDYAFGNSTSLTSISIPAGVSSIGEGLFFNCTSLKSIAFSSSTPPSFHNNAFLVAPGGLQIIVPRGAASAYAAELSGKLPAGAQIIEAVAVGDTFTADGIKYTVLAQSATTGTVEVIANGYSGAITIPDTVDYADITYTVTSIGASAFAYCSGLTSVSLPAHVTAIGNFAFYFCTGLTSLSIPDSVTSIGDYAFSCCWGLTSLSMPEGVTSIGDAAFSSCRQLTSINIPDQLTSIGSNLFASCYGLTSLSIPAGVTSIADDAFYNCGYLTSIVFLRSTPPSFGGSNVFKQVPAGLQVIVPNGATSGYADLLPGMFPNGSQIIETVGIAAISGVTVPLKGVVPADQIIETEQYTGSVAWNPDDSTFSAGKMYTATIALTPKYGYTLAGVAEDYFTVAGADSVSNAADSGVITAVFPVSSDTKVVDIPAIPGVTPPARGVRPVTKIAETQQYTGSVAWSPDDNPFSNTAYTATITLTPKPGYKLAGVAEDFFTVAGADSVSNAADSGVITAKFPGPAVGVGESFTADGIRYTVLTQSASAGTVAVIEKGYTSYTDATIAIPENVKYGGFTYTVTSIGISAFNGCSGLTSISIPGSVTSIGYAAFNGCSGLTNVSIDHVTSIGDYAFNNCTGLASISISGSVTSVGDYAFNNCTGLASISILGSVTSIGNFAFYNCSSLTNLSILDGVTSIGGYAFDRCSSLTSLSILNGTASIGAHAFDSCSGLTSLIVPGSVNSIGDAAFYQCSSLATVTLNNGLQTIGAEAFYCTAIHTITIPNSVTSIGGFAFYSCESLSSATFTGGAPTTFGDQVFYGAAPDFKIRYPAGRTGWTSPTWKGYPADAYYTVTFDSQGGSSVPSKKAYETVITAPASPVKNGYLFAGWYKASDFKNLWNFASDKVTADTTLYAKWTAVIPVGLSCSKSDATVYGGTNGSITVTASGGNSGSYEYSINGGSWQSSNTFGSLGTGTYTVEVRDAGNIGNTATDSVSIGQPAPTPVALSCSKSDVTVYGGTNGSITVTASGGNSGSYEYSINGGNWQSSNTFGSLGTGTYTVGVRDAGNIGNTATAPAITIGLVLSTSYPADKLPSSVNAGTAFKIIPEKSPSGYALQSISFSSGNRQAATVDANGNVFFQAGGKAVITVKMIFQKVSKGKTSTKIITMKKTITVFQPVSSITFSQSGYTVARTKTLALKPTIGPSNASNKKVKWTSSNPRIVSVSSRGVVTGKGVGQVTITCTAQDGSKVSATCTVTVTSTPGR